MTKIRKTTYVILTSLLILMSYLLLQTSKSSAIKIDKEQLIGSSAIILLSDYEPIANRQARMVQATWLILPYRNNLKPWLNEQQTQTYYQQQKDSLNNQPYDVVRYQLAQELAQKQAIKDTYYDAEKWRDLLDKQNIKPNQIPQATLQTTRWVSAYHQEIDADVIRLLLSSPVKQWQTYELPSGDVLVSFVFMRDQDNSRVGLIRRLTENSTFLMWQAAERSF